MYDYRLIGATLPIGKSYIASTSYQQVIGKSEKLRGNEDFRRGENQPNLFTIHFYFLLRAIYTVENNEEK